MSNLKYQQPEANDQTYQTMDSDRNKHNCRIGRAISDQLVIKEDLRNRYKG
jgi:hypothetical protein